MIVYLFGTGWFWTDLNRVTAQAGLLHMKRHSYLAANIFYEDVFT